MDDVGYHKATVKYRIPRPWTDEGDEVKTDTGWVKWVFEAGHKTTLKFQRPTWHSEFPYALVDEVVFEDPMIQEAQVAWDRAVDLGDAFDSMLRHLEDASTELGDAVVQMREHYEFDKDDEVADALLGAHVRSLADSLTGARSAATTFADRIAEHMEGS